jgi:hypothetical protein
MRKPSITTEFKIFLNNIKFDKYYYSLYKKIYNGNVKLTQEIFAFIVLQLAQQTKFCGAFNELYNDVIERKSCYMNQLVYNFKVAVLGKPTMCSQINQFLFSKKISDKEIQFNLNIAFFEFDRIFDEFFHLNDNIKKSHFVRICQHIYYDVASKFLEEKMDLKIKKKVRFSNQINYQDK